MQFHAEIDTCNHACISQTIIFDMTFLYLSCFILMLQVEIFGFNFLVVETITWYIEKKILELIYAMLVCRKNINC